jgi:hypothetical protein
MFTFLRAIADDTLFFEMIEGLVDIRILRNYERNLENSYEALWNKFKNCIKRS